MITIPKYDPIYNVDLDFNGILNNVSIAKVNNLDLAAFTAEFWLKAFAGDGGTFLSYGLEESNPGYKLFNIENVNNLKIWLNNIETLPTGVSVADNHWHFVMIAWQSIDGTISLSVDGTVKWTGKLASSSILITGGKMVIAQAQTAYGFDPAKALKAKVFNFRLWNQPRTAFFSNQDMDRTVPGNAKTTQWQQTGVVGNGASIIALGSTDAVYALDLTGAMLKSTNFGETFVPSVPLPPVPFVQLAAATDWQIGIVALGQVWVTKEGTQWTQPSSCNATIVQASIITGGTGLSVTASNSVYTISDYGATYTEITPTTKLTWVSVSGTTAWGIGIDKKLYIGTNSLLSGWAWVLATTSMPTWVPVQVELLGSMVVVLTSLGQLYYTIDKGDNWTPILTSYPTVFKNMQLLGNTIWAINLNGQLFFAELNTKLVINLMCDEGYGDFAFDTSGNYNNALLGAHMEGGRPTWEVETQLTPPGFVDDGTLGLPSIARTVETLPKEEPPMVASVLTSPDSVETPLAKAKRK